MTYKIKYLNSAWLAIFLIVSILLPIGYAIATTTYLLNISALLSTLNPGSNATQTISFFTSSTGGGVPAGSSFSITFPTTPNTWNISNVAIGDVSMTIGGVSISGGFAPSAGSNQWGWSKSGQVMTFTAPTSGTPIVAPIVTVAVTIASTHFVNPAAGTYTIGIASGTTDTGTATVVIANNVVNVSGTVAQNLTFSLGGTSVALSPNPVTTGGISSGTSTFTLATNAPAGATVAETGTSLTNSNTGSYALTACSAGCGTTPSTLPAAGTEAFGINLAANTGSLGANPTCTGTCGTASPSYNQPDYLWFNTLGDTLTNVTAPINSTTYTISYVANISAVTPAGNYTTALTLTATANF